MGALGLGAQRRQHGLTGQGPWFPPPQVPPHIKAALFRMQLSRSEEAAKKAVLGSGPQVGQDVMSIAEVGGDGKEQGGGGGEGAAKDLRSGHEHRGGIKGAVGQDENRLKAGWGGPRRADLDAVHRDPFPHKRAVTCPKP